MKKLLLASATLALTAGGAFAEDIKLGISLGFTGPLESMSPAMADGAELAMAEVTASGKFMGGAAVTAVRGDSTCIDSAAASATVEKLITADGVKGIVGGMCSGETTASLQNVAMPKGMVMISPSATSPALSSLEDNGLFFRTSPSDARQSEVMTDIIMEHGINSVAVTYTNNDYGKGLADSFEAAFEAKGGTVTINTAHDDGKPDYSAEVAALASAGGDALVIAGYVDQGGSGVLRGALDTGAFDTFVFPDGMVGGALEEGFGPEINGSFGQMPSSEGEGKEKFLAAAEAAGFDGTGVYSAEAYDAAALIMLAMAAADSTDPMVYKENVMDVANAPGTPILPGELGKALDLIAAGEEIDYQGATSVELIGAGESAGTFREIEVKDDKIETVRYR
ncbi:branched-chain amino acid ABC transporter substrate-binding protein [Rhodobacter sp. TJ_12]|uniref:ABC transporter substrate-binding protein n=1 Tax=Rhodobacter sp. TJ_12 TaxID=2029399 RepID=UPI001CC1C06E|nr:ABC transporter substrate-binding protein [Rhodobacter sp. TJ_12]MBZ4022454.1 branched-chain amino acid ABC transporter substrate-binding protein [Rhodobacter sp. TJ_12]